MSTSIITIAIFLSQGNFHNEILVGKLEWEISIGLGTKNIKDINDIENKRN